MWVDFMFYCYQSNYGEIRELKSITSNGFEGKETRFLKVYPFSQILNCLSPSVLCQNLFRLFEKFHWAIESAIIILMSACNRWNLSVM